MMRPLILDLVKEGVEAMLDAREREVVKREREVARDTERFTKASDLKNVMESLRINLEEAMDAIDIPAEEREGHAALVAIR